MLHFVQPGTIIGNIYLIHIVPRTVAMTVVILRSNSVSRAQYPVACFSTSKYMSER
jgi:hypothetical protein